MDMELARAPASSSASAEVRRCMAMWNAEARDVLNNYCVEAWRGGDG